MGVMRKRRTHDGLTVNSVTGTRATLLAFDLTAARQDSFVGFAVQREDPAGDEKVWLRGEKTFAETDPGVGPGSSVRSCEHPFQAFQWLDLDVTPGHEYVYRVHALTGTPTQLDLGEPTTLSVTTEREEDPTSIHSIYVNRGSVASQAYAREFTNEPPSRIDDAETRTAAYKFLSHGLFEGLRRFVDRATGQGWSIHGAIYEFQWPMAVGLLQSAVARGVDVQVVFDAIPGDSGPVKENEKAVSDAGFTAAQCIPRTVGSIMHNKFLVLSEGGTPRAVWTGSTNWTEQGIYGHMNVGHVVDDQALAGKYLTYWEVIRKDHELPDDRDAVEALATRPPVPPESDEPLLVTPTQDWLQRFFEPRRQDFARREYLAYGKRGPH